MGEPIKLDNHTLMLRVVKVRPLDLFSGDISIRTDPDFIKDPHYAQRKARRKLRYTTNRTLRVQESDDYIPKTRHSHRRGDGGDAMSDEPIDFDDAFGFNWAVNYNHYTGGVHYNSIPMNEGFTCAACYIFIQTALSFDIKVKRRHAHASCMYTYMRS